MGEDQHAAGARALDEPERRDRLAGAGRVLEPEAAVGVGIVRGLGELHVVVELVPLVLPVLGLLVVDIAVGVVELGILLAGDRDRCELNRGRGGGVGTAPFPLPLSWASASSAVSVPDSASTWWAESTVSSARRGSSSDSTRSSPSSSENFRRQSIEGLSRAGVQLGQRGVERPPARRPGREGVLERLAFVDEAFAREQLRARNCGRTGKGGGITHTDRKVAFRKCEPRRYFEATQAVSLEAVHGEDNPQKRRCPLAATRLGGMASPIKAGRFGQRSLPAARRASVILPQGQGIGREGCRTDLSASLPAFVEPGRRTAHEARGLRAATPQPRSHRCATASQPRSELGRGATVARPAGLCGNLWRR